MRSEKVRVRSVVDNRVLTHVTERDARLMCGEDNHGDQIPGFEPIAHRLSRKKQALTDIQLLQPMKQERTSPCTLTRSDMERNAFAQAGFALGAENRISAFQASISKFESWEETHDDRNVVISGGKAFGVVHTEIPSQMLSFA